MDIKNVKIFQRANSPYWHLKYEIVLENGAIKIVQMSTKVGLKEFSREYMKQQYAPAKIAQICQSAKIKELDKFEFGFYFDAYCRQNNSKASFGNKLKPRALSALGYFGQSKDVRVITKFDVKEYLLTLTEAKTVSRETLKGHIDVLSNVLELAVDKGVIDKNPATGIKIEGKTTQNQNTL